MQAGIRPGFLIVLALSCPAAAHAEWQVTEKIQTYAITGKTGAELYAAIGERGPMVGGQVRAIAHTGFKLTWSRKYEPQGSDCVLVSARPKLVITYTLPKPAGQLTGLMRKNWQVFIAGLQAHEKAHGAFIVDMVRAIETASTGLSVASDPGCAKIRVQLTKRFAELSHIQRQRSRDFDKVELSEGGNIHQLVLGLVNGP